MNSPFPGVIKILNFFTDEYLAELKRDYPEGWFIIHPEHDISIIIIFH